MRLLRKAVGAVALLLFVVGVNFLLLREEFFTIFVGAPLAGGAVLGLVWFVLWLAGTARRDRASGGGPVNAVIASVFVLGICGMAYAFAARPGWSWDWTEEGRTQLAPQTVQVLESLTEPIEVACFFLKAGDDRARIAQEKTRRFLDRCTAHTDQLRIAFVDPQQHPDQVIKYGASAALQKTKVGAVVLQAGARKREIPLSDVNARLEERDFTNALINVAREAQPKVYFLMGHGGWDLQSEDPKLGGRKFAELLESQSYDLVQIAMTEESPAIPADCSVLIINGFTDDLREFEVTAIDQYLSGGGRLLVLINPLVAANPSGATIERLRPWLERRLGLRLPTNVLVSNETGGVQIALLPDFSMLPEFLDPMGGKWRFRGSYNADHPITAALDKTLGIQLVRTVDPVEEPPNGATHAVLLRSTPGSWAETDLNAIMNGQKIAMEPGEARGPHAIAVGVTLDAEVDTADESRPREGRAVVIGNAYLTTNEFVVFGGAQDLLLNAVGWLTASEELIAIRASIGAEEPILLTRAQQRMIAWVASLGTVQAIALLGTVVLLWRRRYG